MGEAADDVQRAQEDHVLCDLPCHRHHLCGLVLVCAHRPHRRGDQAGSGNRYVVRMKGVPSQGILNGTVGLRIGDYSRLISKSDLQCLGFWREISVMMHHTSFLDVSCAVVVVCITQSGDFPGNPVVNTLPSNVGAQVRSLVRELRSIPHALLPGSKI